MCPPYPECITDDDLDSQYQSECESIGCMDNTACNLDATALYSYLQDSCWHPNEGCECEDGQGSVVDNCEVCDWDTENDCIQDCNDAWGGDSVIDECGVCGGAGAVFECGCNDPIENFDCDGNCIIAIDDCGTCGGDNYSDGYYCPDLKVLQEWIPINNSNMDGVEPLEFGWQSWQNGRLISFDFVPSIHGGWGQWGISSFPESIGNLTELESLGLGHNHLNQDSFPESFSNLQKLEYLGLNHNNLYGEIPEILGSLKNLRQLRLNDNNLTSIPDTIWALTSLEHLDLSWNDYLSGQIPESISNMTNLRFLSVHNNAMSGEIPFEALYNLPNLTTFNIQNCNFSGVIPESICDFEAIDPENYNNNSFSGNRFCCPYPICNGNAITNYEAQGWPDCDENCND